MRHAFIFDLFERGYFWPETTVLRQLAWWYDLDEEDLFRDLLLSRN